LHSLSPAPRQTLRCQMKLNTNIPKWLSHRAGLFGNTGSSLLALPPRKASGSPGPEGQMAFHSSNQILTLRTQRDEWLFDGPGTLTCASKLWMKDGKRSFPVGPFRTSLNPQGARDPQY
jgi:hypothetical protein